MSRMSDLHIQMQASNNEGSVSWKDEGKYHPLDPCHPPLEHDNTREAYRQIIIEHICAFLGVRSTGNISIFAGNLADELLALQENLM